MLSSGQIGADRSTSDILKPRHCGLLRNALRNRRKGLQYTLTFGLAEGYKADTGRHKAGQCCLQIMRRDNSV